MDIDVHPGRRSRLWHSGDRRRTEHHAQHERQASRRIIRFIPQATNTPQEHDARRPDLRRIIGSAESIPAHSVCPNESTGPGHRHGRRVWWTVHTSTWPIVLFRLRLELVRFLQSAAFPMALRKATVPIKKVDVRLVRQLRVFPDARDPDERFRREQVDRQCPRRVGR
jgi:hypothetical protein